MTHSPKFNTVKKNYDKGFWNLQMVANAVTKRWITADEFTEITGEAYQV